MTENSWCPPPVVQSIDGLLPLVESILGATGTVLLGIEGASTSGKSTTAARLADRLGGTVVKTDEFYRREVRGSNYQDGLRLDELAQVLREALDEGSVVIIEGICLRETIVLLNVEVQFFVYCKKLSAVGVWHGDPELNLDLRPESEDTQETIDWWWFDYHRRAFPLEKASVVLEWSDAAL